MLNYMMRTRTYVNLLGKRKCVTYAGNVWTPSETCNFMWDIFAYVDISKCFAALDGRDSHFVWILDIWEFFDIVHFVCLTCWWYFVALCMVQHIPPPSLPIRCSTFLWKGSHKTGCSAEWHTGASEQIYSPHRLSITADDWCLLKNNLG